MTAKSLWVAGSYARGATECGDLDLILEATINGVHPPSRTIAKGLYGSAQDTSLYIGTPELNSANVAFPEARLVWSEERPDWKANLEALEVDPEAGRFPRTTDALPLRPDQLSASIDELERLLELRDSGVLKWEFLQAEDIAQAPGALERADIYAEHYGAKTRDALRLAISHHIAVGRGGEWVQADGSERTRFRCGGTFFLTAYPSIPLDQLDHPACDLLALVPHRSRRGPNGIWFITRGPEHPVEKLFAKCQAFYVTYQGKPMLFSDESHSPYRPATGIELFRLQEDALEHAEMERDFVEDEGNVELASAAGPELLQLIAGCDLVVVDGISIAISRSGQLAIEHDPEEKAEISSAAELAAALAGDEVAEEIPPD
ncbi:MAG TPA: hypothetical protein VF006_18180 [Longimicrobium sp.]